MVRVILLLLRRSYRKKKFLVFCFYCRFFNLSKTIIYLYICDILLPLRKIHFSINQRMSWTFALIWTFFLVQIELFFFQLFIFPSFSCSFFQSLDVSQLLTVSASEHYMDIYAFLFLRMERTELISGAISAY